MLPWQTRDPIQIMMTFFGGPVGMEANMAKGIAGAEIKAMAGADAQILFK